MKSYSFLKVHEFFIVWLLETLHVGGTAMLFFLVLPKLDSLRYSSLLC